MMWTEVELFEWNGVISIRELVSKKTVLVIWRPFCPGCGLVLDGQARLQLVRTEIGPKLVELMNFTARNEKEYPWPPLNAPQAPQTVQESPTANSNGHNGHSEADFMMALYSKDLSYSDKTKLKKVEKTLKRLKEKYNG